MKTKKEENKIVPKVIDWPPFGIGKTNVFNSLMDKNRVAQRCFDQICSVYPEFVNVWTSLFNHFPDEELPLLIGQDLPGFVLAEIERIFKNTNGGQNV